MESELMHVDMLVLQHPKLVTLLKSYICKILPRLFIECGILTWTKSFTALENDYKLKKFSFEKLRLSSSIAF